MSEPIKFTFAPEPIKEREDNLPEYPEEAIEEKRERVPFENKMMTPDWETKFNTTRRRRTMLG